MTEQPDALREFTRAMFADPDAPPPTPEPGADELPRGNVVPREGSNPEMRRPRGDLAAFTRSLFGNEDR